ncbi:MAG: nucleotidyl transferase AbiEii/AbiGii toxin family protein [Lachnospiraceae bacterium]|nr:nucleotidyl transferase AbiEii/AbiGii toxin family protein [Lachnospiraceae bacterium]
MGDIASSVLARLKNKAKESGRSYQLCLQLFCQEEFLRRLQKSRHVENLVLKGGLFIYSLTEFDSRVTVDIDFLLRKIPNTPEQLRSVVEEIIAVETGNDFVSFEIKDVAPIAVAKKYVGVGVTMIAKIKNTRTPFSIDFGVGDVIVPKQEKRKIPTQLDDFDAPVINTYSIETTVAEKIDAILSLMEFSSRMKDYYDIYYLAHKFDFEGKVLCEALSKTFANREHKFTMEQFEQIMTFDKDDGMQKKWKTFTKKIDIEMDEFSVILQSIQEFLCKPYTAVMNGEVFENQWDANEGKWKKV